MNPRVLAYLRLLRLPTVFTALADIFLGFLLTHPTLISDEGPNTLPSFLLLCAASAGLYLSGMVFNDYFDRLIDSQERPNRPIPSGAILPATALRLAAGLMLIGLGSAAAVGPLSLGVAVAVSAAILAYDGGLKKTWLGPLVMGACRSGNVLLGASAVGSLFEFVSTSRWPIAIGLGIYIAGVTLFARQEATTSRRTVLAGAAGVINSGVVGLAMFVNTNGLMANRLPALGILAMILFTLDRRLAVAIAQPSPQHVQLAVKVLLLSLVMLDATLIYAFNGNVELAMATVALLIPAIGLSRLIAMT
ncbi:MAG: 4-hydroxybenzoate octaprenyltransferase [Planctomycetota bacterium]|nr:MAG: 4-hydroxybenzoate octaprenyltransferase [Planctomycetota bacterium]